jgi:hypothetical protein
MPKHKPAIHFFGVVNFFEEGFKERPLFEVMVLIEKPFILVCYQLRQLLNIYIGRARQ